MKNSITLIFILAMGAVYGQNCDLPTYELRAGKGQESVLNYSAIYHLGGSDCSGFGRGQYICHSGMAFGMMPGMHKSDAPLDNKRYEFVKADCSSYSISYPVDSTYQLDTSRFTAYAGHSRDLDYLDLPCETSVMDINLLFDRDSLVSLTLIASAYGDYNTELHSALTKEFNLRYGAPIDSLINAETGDPSYRRSVYTWSSTFCNRQKTIRIQRIYNIQEDAGEKIILEFLSDQFKLD